MKHRLFMLITVLVTLGSLLISRGVAAEPKEAEKATIKDVAAKYKAMKSKQIDLVEVSLDLTELGYGSVDRDKVRLWLHNAADKVKKRMAGTKDPAIALRAFKKVIYDDLKVKRAGDIRDVEHTFLSRIMKDRSGQCVGMSTLFAVVGRRAGLDFRIVVAPKHVFVRYHAGESVQNIETLESGRILSDAEVSRRASNRFLQSPSKMHFKTVSNKVVAAMMFNSLGVLYFEKGNTAEAAQALRASIDLAPDLDLHYANLAVLYRLSGKYKDAERMSRLGVEKAENADDPHRELAALYFIQGRFDESVKEAGLYAAHSVPLRSSFEVTSFLNEAATQAKIKRDGARLMAERAFRSSLRKELAQIKAIKARELAEKEKKWLTPIKFTDEPGLLERLRALTPNESEDTYRKIIKYLHYRKDLSIPYRMSYVFMRRGHVIVIRKRSKAEIAGFLQPILVSDSKAIAKRLRDLIINIPKRVVDAEIRKLQAGDHARVTTASFVLERDGDQVFVSMVKAGRRMMIDAESFDPEPFRIRIKSSDLPPASLNALKASLRLQVAKKTMSKPNELPEAMSFSEKNLTATIHILEDSTKMKALRAEVDHAAADVAKFLKQTSMPKLRIRSAVPAEVLDVVDRTPLTRGKDEIASLLLLVRETHIQGAAPGNFFINGRMSQVRADKTRPLSRAVSFRWIKGSIEAAVAPHLASAIDPQSRRLFGLAYYLFRLQLARTTRANLEKEPRGGVHFLKKHTAYHNAVAALLARAWLLQYAKAHNLAIEAKEIDARLAEYAPVSKELRKKAERLGVKNLIAQYTKSPNELFQKTSTK